MMKGSESSVNFPFITLNSECSVFFLLACSARIFNIEILNKLKIIIINRNIFVTQIFYNCKVS